jgi:PAS domain S-box-containing protein
MTERGNPRHTDPGETLHASADAIILDSDRLGTFRQLVEQSRAGIYLMRRDGFAYVNPRLAEIFGYTVDEMLEHVKPLDLVAAEDRDMVAARIRERFSGAVASDCYTFRGVRRDGDRVDVEVHGSLVQLDGSRAVLGTVVDVTERARLEQVLRASEERYRLVMRGAGVAVWDWDLATGAIHWNGQYEQVLRCRAADIGSSIEWWYERIHPSERERVVSGITAAIGKGGQLWSDEYRFRRGDGSYATILDRCFVVRNEPGVAARVVGSMLDVTERRRTEDAQRFLARASTLLDLSLDEQSVLDRLVRLAVPELAECCLLDLQDADGSIRRAAAAHADAAFEARLRRSGCFDRDADAALFPIVRAIRTGEPILVAPYDAPRRQSTALDLPGDGDVDELGVHAFMVLPLAARGRVLGTLTLGAADPERHYGPAELVVAENLAHRAAVAIDNGRLYTEAQDALRARDEVLRVVSHDLRNPLDAIQLTAALLLDSGEERRQDAVDKLQLIRKVALQMNDMIQDLLDASVMEAGRFEVSRSAYSAARLVDEACQLLQPLAETRGVELHCAAPRPDARVSVDPTQILRVFSNLVGNAIKFTPAGGRVNVRAETRPEALEFVVTDTGPGIPPAEIPQVFKRFWQGRKGDRRGAGLGLVIASGIVEAHGGTISARSQPGTGATFTFTLPRVVDPEAGRQS